MTCCICRVALIVSENQLVEYVYEAVEDVIALHLNPYDDGNCLLYTSDAADE